MQGRIHFKRFIPYAHRPPADPQSYYAVAFSAFGYGTRQVFDTEYIDNPELIDGGAAIMGIGQEYYLAVVIRMFAR
jgi:hypothetical protein